MLGSLNFIVPSFTILLISKVGIVGTLAKFKSIISKIYNVYLNIVVATNIMCGQIVMDSSVEQCKYIIESKPIPSMYNTRYP